MQIQYTLEELEGFDRTWTDRFALQSSWEAHDLSDPVDDLELFFTHLSGTNILDVGCGWGRYVLRFSERHLGYLGIDNSLEMLKVARTTNPALLFIQGSFRFLPFAGEQFDGLWNCCTLGAIPKANLVDILEEHHRVLKAGGVMMIIMPAPPFSEEVLYLDDEDKPEIYQAHYHLDEFEEHVKKAGFTIVDSGYRMREGSMFVLVRK